MATVEITTQSFNDTVKDGIVLLDFWAEWCGPCRMFSPVFEKVSEKNDDITFGKVNTEEQGELAAAFQIRSIPTLMVMRDGIILHQQAGALPQAALEDLVDQVRKVDMDAVREQVAKESGKAN